MIAGMVIGLRSRQGVMLPGCRSRWPPSIGISPGSYP